MPNQPNHEPTLEEIKAMCEIIRGDWDEHEHWQRRGFPDGKPPVTVTVTRVRNLPGQRKF